MEGAALEMANMSLRQLLSQGDRRKRLLLKPCVGGLLKLNNQYRRDHSEAALVVDMSEAQHPLLSRSKWHASLSDSTWYLDLLGSLWTWALSRKLCTLLQKRP